MTSLLYSPMMDSARACPRLDRGGVVAGVAHASHRRHDAHLHEALGVAQREILHDPVAVMDEPFTGRTALMKGLFEGVEGQVRVQ